MVSLLTKIARPPLWLAAATTSATWQAVGSATRWRTPREHRRRCCVPTLRVGTRTHALLARTHALRGCATGLLRAHAERGHEGKRTPARTRALREFRSHPRSAWVRNGAAACPRGAWARGETDACSHPRSAWVRNGAAACPRGAWARGETDACSHPRSAWVRNVPRQEVHSSAAARPRQARTAFHSNRCPTPSRRIKTP